MTYPGRHALCLGFAAAFVVGCGGSPTLPAAAPPSLHAIDALRPSAPSEKVLYRFKGGPDGSGPEGSLTFVNSTYYGTTYFGGARNAGTLYSLSALGKHRVLYSFKGPSADGQFPLGNLINVNGKLYGTTAEGGYNGVGTVFAVDASGNEQVVYSFKGGTADGEFPAAGLISVNGKLYGTTEAGGKNEKGTIFSLSTSGSERLIYSFKGSNDGAYPLASLIEVKGLLYGTASDLVNGGGWGTIFSITTGGKERTLYEFKGPPDGATPYAGLINVRGIFYGTTYAGGTSGWGTVFSVAPSGKAPVLYSFKGGTDGQSPEAPLINVKGTLYGTTYDGGGEQSRCDGCGTVFQISTSGSEKIIYSFQDDPDGAYPVASLITSNNALLGATDSGGYGQGTVFRIAPPPSLIRK